MSTDRELLEAAAKAAGIELIWHEPVTDEAWCFIPSAKPPHNRREQDKNAGVIWNPLEDDGDALRLAVKLGIWVGIDAGFATYVANTDFEIASSTESEPHGTDPYAATRRAIVRAAAALAPTPKEKAE